MIIAIDFDGTIVEDMYPEIGPEIPFATETLRMLIQQRHRLILWTVREGRTLEEAVEWCRERGVEFYAVNKDFPEEDETKNKKFSRKIKADCYIDDRAIGGMPSWGEIYQIITTGKTFKQILREKLPNKFEDQQPPKRKHWWNR